MSRSPLISVLIAGLEKREGCPRLLRMLDAQAGRLQWDCEILTLIDNGESTSGVKRQRLLQEAAGQYVVYIDDDDEVTNDYLEKICEKCHRGPDVVTFDLLFLENGKEPRSWRFDLGNWYDDFPSGQMMPNHLCAWKTTIARQVAWCPWLGFSDDKLWYRPLLASGVVKRQSRVDSVLYRYNFCTETSANQTSDLKAFAHEYAQKGLRCFKDGGGEILIEDGSQHLAKRIRVRDRNNHARYITLGTLHQFHTILL